MSELRIENYVMPAAFMGSDNPLPQLRSNLDLHDSIASSDDTFGTVKGCLPYLVQNGYGRTRRDRSFVALVLENEILRATFLPELGGRLWSLVHRPSDRELLHVNRIFQPANLALRNAWFSGGVEWNCGVMGHTPLTCSPLFAACTTHDDGSPVLRLYEWERIRQVPYQIDAWLPDGSPVLFLRVQILNPHDHQIAMYWWSNIAVDEFEGGRVITPADRAYHFDYHETIEPTPIPYDRGMDVTYPTNLPHACDFFYDIPDDRRKWITHVDAAGNGLIQTSTSRLFGRKLFAWGQGAGGKNWQSYLAARDMSYIEIQAGLTRVQTEYIRMPARAEWSWTEAYGLMEADPARTHDKDWQVVKREIESKLERLLPEPTLERQHERARDMAVSPPHRVLHTGSGWGALERRRREKFNEVPFCGSSLLFDDASLGPEQGPWLDLLERGAIPCPSTDVSPVSYMVQDQWRSLLETAIETEHGGHWFGWLHLGVMRHYAGDTEGASRAWESSCEDQRNAWALRNLAILAQQTGDHTKAMDLYRESCRTLPALVPLAEECSELMLKQKSPHAWLDLLSTLDPTLQNHDRIRFISARAHLHLDDFETVERFFANGAVLPDLREGETSLSDLWFDMVARRRARDEGIPLDDALRDQVRRDATLPKSLDFRMS